MNIGKSHRLGSGSGLFMKFRFHIIRKSILKYNELLKEMLPDLGPVSIITIPNRSFINSDHASQLKLVDYLKLPSNSVEKETYSRKHQSTVAIRSRLGLGVEYYNWKSSNCMDLSFNEKPDSRDFLLKDFRKGEYVTKECLTFEIDKPLMFSVDFSEEFEEIRKLRELILANFSVLKAKDRLNTLKNLEVTPEFEPETLELMKSEGVYTKTRTEDFAKLTWVNSPASISNTP